GNWYELYSGKYFKGGQNIQADAPYSHIPVFVKEGSIIPFGPEMQYSTEKPADPVTLYVYTGHDASFSLYEDENLNYNYEKGKYSIIPISYNEKAKTLKIGKRQGLFPGMLNSRTFKIVWIHYDKPVALNLNNENLQTVKYDGSEVLIKEK
ncbi:MAG: DUF5110 domain-containing protein, partial [Bacteroidota bacterium]|nr:DUF5110 domain-containing protein [Bacteroidota bacterium]